jgi:hypothetical protein
VVTAGSYEVADGRYHDAHRHLTEADGLAQQFGYAWLATFTQVQLGTLAVARPDQCCGNSKPLPAMKPRQRAGWCHGRDLGLVGSELRRGEHVAPGPGFAVAEELSVIEENAGRSLGKAARV